MNIVHIIGNGFDLNQGMPTSYAHFYEYYLQLIPKDGESDSIMRFRELLIENLKNEPTKDWADLEKTMGKLTTEFDKVEDYVKVYLDVYTHLNEYLNMVYKHSEVQKFDNQEKTLFADLCQPWQHLTTADIRRLESMIPIREDYRVSIINFNYTDTIYRISDISTKEGTAFTRTQYSTAFYDGCKHVHHTLAGNDIIFGVDNAGQIDNTKFRDDERIQNYLIKPQTNSGMGTMIDNVCKSLIDNAHLICIYGMSIGHTDDTWWQAIGRHLGKNNKVCVLYFPFEKNIANLLPISYHLEWVNYKRHLMSMMGLKEQEPLQRIFVHFCNRPNYRNIFSNAKRSNLTDNFENVMARFQKDGVIRRPVEKRNDRMSLKLMPPIDDTQFIKPKIYRERIISYDLHSNEGMHIKMD